jgi:hypothetical protein
MIALRKAPLDKGLMGDCQWRLHCVLGKALSRGRKAT